MANQPANAGPNGEQVPPSAARATPAPRAMAGHRAAPPPANASPAPNVLAWLLYLLVLAGVAAGLVLATHAPWDMGRGTGLVGCSLLAAGVARLVLPPRYAGLLATRRKASDVLAFTVLGAGVLAVALLLP